MFTFEDCHSVMLVGEVFTFSKAPAQGSKNRVSPVRLGRVVTDSALTASISTPDTRRALNRMELGINRQNSVNSAEFPR